MFKGTYTSSDPWERAEAYRHGYRTVCHHPKEIGIVEIDELLVIDFDNVLFNDKYLAMARAREAAERGVLALKQAKILSPNGANAAGPYYGFSPTSSD